MAEEKKVLLVLMEGPNDERSTYSHIETFVEKVSLGLKTQQKPIFYDITNQTEKKTFIDTQHIKSLINKKINEALREYHISKKDLSKVILIIDIDGVYLDDDLFIENPSIEHIEYNEKYVLCKNKKSILDRNERKRNNINFLLNYAKYLMGVPFKVYFYSCNSEHVIFDEMNCSEERKRELSNESMNMDDELFWRNICSETVTLSNDYEDSWNIVSDIDDLIPRCTNLNTLYLELRANIEEKGKEEKTYGENENQHKRDTE